MEVDNFDQVIKFIRENYWTYCCNSNYFWHIQLIIRHKDNPEIVNTLNKNKGNANRSFMEVFISSDSHLRDNRELISKICSSVGARAYIHLCPKSYQKAARGSMINMTDAICTENWMAARTSYKSTVAKAGVEKLFILDYDSKDADKLEIICQEVENTKHKNDTREKLVLDILPTKNGFHIITKPFDVGRFVSPVEDLEVKKDALTLLYFNDGK